MSDYGGEVNAVGGWKSAEGRTMIRKKFRNNPSEPRSCGILNGMPEAISYAKTGIFERDPWDYVLTYTDGIAAILFNKDGDINGEIADLISHGNFKVLERLCKSKVSNQGTLVIRR